MISPRPTGLRFVGASALTVLRGLGAVSRLGAATLWLFPRSDKKELLRAMAEFGTETLGLAMGVAVVVGGVVILQTTLYVERYGARGFLGWAASYAVLWEFGPLFLSLLMAARVGSRHAAELASLQIGGQLEGLSGISLDPLSILVVPRIVALVLSVVLLAAPTYLVAILCELVASRLVLALPARVFIDSLAARLSIAELGAGLVKTVAFACAVALVSSIAGLRAQGGAKAVGQAAARAVVWSAAAIFGLDFALSALLLQLAGGG